VLGGTLGFVAKLSVPGERNRRLVNRGVSQRVPAVQAFALPSVGAWGGYSDRFGAFLARLAADGLFACDFGFGFELGFGLAVVAGFNCDLCVV